MISEVETMPIVRVVADKSITKKKTYTLKMSANGQITIPKEMREDLGWHPGDVLVFIPQKKSFSVHKRVSLREEMVNWRKSLSRETNEMIKKTAGWTLNQYHEYFDNLPENVEEMEREYGLKKD